MENQKGSVRIKPLSLTDLSSAFIILGLGLSFSFLVFIIERFVHAVKIYRRSGIKIVKVLAPPRVATKKYQPRTQLATEPYSHDSLSISLPPSTMQTVQAKGSSTTTTTESVLRLS